MPPPPPPVLSLPDELIEEVFFRLPPDEPEHLARASLACKLWLGLLTGPSFRGRYRDFHGAPPMLGFVYSWPPFSRQRSEDLLVPQFFPTTKFGGRIPKDGWLDLEDSECGVLDCRHGRVLLGDYGKPTLLIVWDPMTGCRTKLGAPKGCNMPLDTEFGGAAVLCAVAGCDHRACHQGPFRVVFFGMSTDDGAHGIIHVRVSSVDTGEWSEPCPGLDFGIESSIMPVPPVFIQDTLYFTGCDHRACHQGPFRVVFFGMSTDDGAHGIIHVRVSSVDTGEWSEPCPGLDFGIESSITPVPPVFIQDTLYFTHNIGEHDQAGIIKYNLGSNCLSHIDPPRAWALRDDLAILMAMEDGSLGFAQVHRLTFYLWTRQTGYDGVASWTQSRVINLRNLLPIQNPDKRLRLIGSVEGSDIVFVTTDLSVYEINIKSLLWKKLWKREKFYRLIPYMSFHHPQERVIDPLRCGSVTTQD